MAATRRQFLQAMGLGAMAFGSGFQEKPHRPPNVVIIFADDQGYGDAGCYGAKGFTTPNLDKLASQGMRFTSFYASQAVCSASRASLLTGCYAERVSILGALSSRSRHGINPEEETLAEILKRKNYATGIFGKWHLGHYKPFLPLQHGFDEYLGLPYSNDMWPVDYDGNPDTGRKAGYPVLPLIEQNEKKAEIRTLKDQDKLTTLYTEGAVRFIEKNRDKPFFLYLPHSMPHVPLGVSDKFRGKSEQGMYGDVIMEIDWSVGQVMETLKKHGLEENTIVIYTSDNGPWLNYGNHAGNALPLREGKLTMFEGGPRVPCIMRWPGRIPAGRVCNEMAATIDILPTLGHITGAGLPKKKIDGVNILPLMEGKPGARPRDHYYFYFGKQLRAVREGDWKLYFPHRTNTYQKDKPGKNGHPGKVSTFEMEKSLYNLKEDIKETKNLIDQHPQVVKRLEALAEKMRQELGDQLTGRKGKGVRPAARLPSDHSKHKKVNHLAKGKSITLKTPPHMKYAGGGENALIDGIRATDNYTDGYWQGFEEKDMEALIDLGEAMPIKHIGCGFLQDQEAWIFLPRSVHMAVSEDGKSFKTVKTWTQKVGLDRTLKIKNVSVKLDGAPYRFVRVVARNVGFCPAWHHGAKGQAWVFADEISIK